MKPVDGTNPRLLLSALNKLEDVRDSSVAQQKRDFKRFIIRGEAECRPADGFRSEQQRPILVQIRDISFGGLGFVCQEVMPVGTFWRVCFVSGGYVVGAQMMMVRHCRQVGSGVFLVGGQFCAEAGLLCLLGVDPAEMRQAGRAHSENSQFIPPAEVA